MNINKKRTTSRIILYLTTIIIIAWSANSIFVSNQAKEADGALLYEGVIKKISCEYNSYKHESLYRFDSISGNAIEFYLPQHMCNKELLTNAADKKYTAYFIHRYPLEIIIGKYVFIDFQDQKTKHNETYIGSIIFALMFLLFIRFLINNKWFVERGDLQ